MVKEPEATKKVVSNDNVVLGLLEGAIVRNVKDMGNDGPCQVESTTNDPGEFYGRLVSLCDGRLASFEVLERQLEAVQGFATYYAYIGPGINQASGLAYS